MQFKKIVYSQPMEKAQITAVKKLLKQPQKIAITTHRNPDGDAYGSSLALYWYLKKLGHNVSVISPNDSPEFLKWLPGVENIIIFEEDKEKAKKVLSDSKIVFALDYNALHRTGDMMGQFLEQQNFFFIMIDHHQQPDGFAKYLFSDPAKASTCELMYLFIEELGDEDLIDKDIATCLYTGIVTDTGSFKFAATDVETHQITAALFKKGIDHTNIHHQLFDTNSYNRLQLLSTALHNLRWLPKYRVAYISLSQKELHKYHFQKGDTEGFVNYGLSIDGVVFAAIFIEDQKQGIIKISFRSKGNFSVNEFARLHFNGGGHINAAGGRSEDTLIETIQRFIKILPEYQDKIDIAYETL